MNVKTTPTQEARAKALCQTLLDDERWGPAIRATEPRRRVQAVLNIALAEGLDELERREKALERED